jgi:hypothetical protein
MGVTHTTVFEQPGVAARLRGAFPQTLANEVDAVLRVIPADRPCPSDCEIGFVRLFNEDLHIPSAASTPNVGVADIVASWETFDYQEVSHEQEVYRSSVG